MENIAVKKNSCDFEIQHKSSFSPRKRALTTLKLQWVAERMRKYERIRKAIAEGNYRVDSHDVAKSILSFRAADRP